MLIPFSRSIANSRSARLPRGEAAKLLAGVLLCAAYAAPAQAALSDTLHPFASLSYSYDDNLFRLPDDAPGFVGPRNDTIRQALVGLDFKRPIGRQVLSATAKVSRVNFDHYSELGYDGKDFLAALEYHIGNHVSGQVRGAYVQTLTSFRDSNSRERSLRTQRSGSADMAWRFHPSWQVRGGVSSDKFSYDLVDQQINDRTEDLTELGVDYVASSGSRVGVVARRLTGKYAKLRNFGGQRIDDGFTQDEIKASINWMLTGVTQVQGLVGWARREHTYFVSRDSSGLNGRLNLTWSPLGKLQLNTSVWREFTAIESSFITNSLNKGVSVGATWNATAKMNVTGQLRREKRDFNESPNVVLRNNASDDSRYATLGLTYVAAPYLQVGVNAFHETRAGSPVAGTTSYRANGASINITAQF